MMLINDPIDEFYKEPGTVRDLVDFTYERLRASTRGVYDIWQNPTMLLSREIIRGIVDRLCIAIGRGYISVDDIKSGLVEIQLLTKSGIIGIPITKKHPNEPSVYIDKKGRVTKSSKDAVYKTGEQKLIIIDTDIHMDARCRHEFNDVLKVIDLMAIYLHTHDMF